MLMTIAVRAILFDADGVVIIPWRFDRYLEREHGITPQMTRRFFHKVFEDCLTGKADLKEVLPPFLSEWGWAESVDDFIATWLEVEDAVGKRVVAVIHDLRQSGYLCCLASNQERCRAEYMTTVMGFSEIFDQLFFSHSIGHQKPDHSYYRSIEKLLGFGGESILFWDDSPVNVASARECGWKAEVYTSFADFEEKLAEYL
jgi:putative hydrolase of the HAD superfamily